MAKTTLYVRLNFRPLLAWEIDNLPREIVRAGESVLLLDLFDSSDSGWQASKEAILTMLRFATEVSASAAFYHPDGNATIVSANTALNLFRIFAPQSGISEDDALVLIKKESDNLLQYEAAMAIWLALHLISFREKEIAKASGDNHELMNKG